VLIKRAAVGSSHIHGLGLIARQHIPSGEVIDESPVLLTTGPVPRAFEAHVYRLEDRRAAMPCGDSIFTNHAADPNAAPRADLRRRVIVLVALRDIEPGEEVTIDYDASIERVQASTSR
jgi:SET domain-containing protein